MNLEYDRNATCTDFLSVVERRDLLRNRFSFVEPSGSQLRYTPLEMTTMEELIWLDRNAQTYLIVASRYDTETDCLTMHHENN
jgi:hypothetical protein